MTAPKLCFHTILWINPRLGLISLDPKSVSPGCKNSNFVNFKNSMAHIFFSLRHQPSLWVDIFSRKFVGSHHIDKNSMSKELGLSRRHDDAMRHFDQIPSWVDEVTQIKMEEWFELILYSASEVARYLKKCGSIHFCPLCYLGEVFISFSEFFEPVEFRDSNQL